MIVWHRHHITPKHAGGTDDTSNILKCNVAMHAFMHEQRYRDVGDEYDRLAAAGLRGYMSEQELHIAKARESGYRSLPALHAANKRNNHYERLGSIGGKAATSNTERHRERSKKGGAVRGEQMRNTYEVTHPSGKAEIVTNLKEFCETYDLNLIAMHTVGRGLRKRHKQFGNRRLD